ncbi:single-stranded DNA-binding protein [Nocardioides sambongensis]|uniref:single-stranded DNA-binding protein n=1 Tax=Nocardioides sambongensis TaxID=2589074 RepID=UPI001E5449C5|nr:single-stranded DNA-binding protein [Nocardioides sambongensis]
MSIPTQMSLTGFIASPPEIHFSESGTARMHARIGCEHYRKEVDGSFTKLDPTFHDLVVFGDTALKAYERFRKGDAFLASGYIHEYEVPPATPPGSRNSSSPAGSDTTPTAPGTTYNAAASIPRHPQHSRPCPSKLRP